MNVIHAESVSRRMLGLVSRLRAPALEVAVMGATGAIIGYAAWLRDDFLVAVLLLPFAANFARRRVGAFALMYGYFAAGNVELPAMVGSFYTQPHPLIQYAAPLVLTVLLAAPFLLYAAGASPWKRIASWFVALVVLTVPPIGLLAWRNPLFLAGSLYPHTDLLGVVLVALLLSTMAGLRGHGGKAWPRAALLAVLVMVSGVCVVRGQFPMNSPAVNWAAVGTHAAPAFTAHAQTERTAATIATMNQAIPLDGFTAVILPESAIEPYRPVDEVMLFESSDAAARQGKALVFGAVIEDGHGGWRDAVMGAGTLAGHDGAPRVLTEARVPMPVGNWHLGFPGGAPLRAFATDRGEIAGVPVAWSICYEDTILWPHGFLLTGHPAALVALDDDWVLSGTRAARAQAISARQLAKMAGVLLVSAVND